MARAAELSDAQHGTRAWRGPCEAHVPAWAWSSGVARVRNGSNALIALAVVLRAWARLSRFLGPIPRVRAVVCSGDLICGGGHGGEITRCCGAGGKGGGAG